MGVVQHIKLNKMKQIFLALIFIITTVNIYSQSISKREEIKIKYNNGLEIFNVLNENVKIDFDVEKEYFWYTEFSKIKSTKGGSAGKLLDGNYKFFDENGNLIVDGNYSKGLKNGESKKWDKQGEITEITRYDNGKSIYLKYHPKGYEGWVEQIGQILKDGWIKNSYSKYGKLVSKQETFFDESDKIKKLKTKTTLFYPNSENQIKEVYITPMMFDNSLIGEYTTYFKNGQVKISGNFFDSLKNGIENYFGNIQTGDWKWYSENGTLDTQEKYKVEIKYWVNGNIKSTYGMAYDNNGWIKHGPFYSFSEDGKGIAEKTEYSWGKLKVSED